MTGSPMETRSESENSKVGERLLMDGDLILRSAKSRFSENRTSSALYFRAVSFLRLPEILSGLRKILRWLKGRPLFLSMMT